MRLVPANHSGYPRVGEGSDAQRVRRAYAERERGELDEAGYAAVVQGYVDEIVAEQRDAGCAIVTDGLVGWYDPVSHPAGRLEGVAIRGLLRWFDTNFYVRQPEVTGQLSGSYGLVDGWRAAGGTEDVKAVVTGPYTLARHSILGDDSPYSDIPSLTLAYAEILAEDARALAEAGCTLVQVDEPSLLRHPYDAIVVRQALERIDAPLTICLATWWGNAATLYAELRDMPVGMLGLDLCADPEMAGILLREELDRPVALGIVDGRTTRADDLEALTPTLAKLADAADQRGIGTLHVQPSCSLELLPRDRARRKLALAAELAASVVA